MGGIPYTLVRSVVAAVALLAVVLPARAEADFRGEVATTTLLSRAADGGLPNGACHHPDISRDERLATMAVFTCEASNMVAGDTNGVSDVFAVHRAGPVPDNGTAWGIGATELISVGLGGAPANGRSWNAQLDGAPGLTPHCVAFLSDASNLVGRDTNGKTDAFVRDLRTHRTVRVSVATGGRQASGTTYGVAIDPDCTRVAFSSDAPGLALTRSKVHSARALLTRRPRRGTRQVYLHVIHAAAGTNQQLNGFTYLASANDRGVPGNGQSDHPSLAKQRGPALAFTSTSSNLARGDGNGQPDVFVRWMLNLRRHRFTTRLVSAVGGHSGSGVSSTPSIAGDGQRIGFQTNAPDLAPGALPGREQVLEAVRKDPGFFLACVSCSLAGPGDGRSFDPAMSYSGHFVTFTSGAANFVPPGNELRDANGVADAFLSIVITQRVYAVAQSSQGRSLVYPSGPTAVSARGNYILFQSADLQTDQTYMLIHYPSLYQTTVRLLGGVQQLLIALGLGIALPGVPSLPPLDLIYMRYLGPE